MEFGLLRVVGSFNAFRSRERGRGGDRRGGKEGRRKGGAVEHMFTYIVVSMWKLLILEECVEGLGTRSSH